MRWLKFNAVGALGTAVQLGVLWILKHWLHYLVATAIAVEIAVLHNYAWHVYWTWADRPDRLSWNTLFRFLLGNGLVSLVSNLILMRVFTGTYGIPEVPANLMAIGITSVVNFLLGDRWVFGQKGAVHPGPAGVGYR